MVNKDTTFEELIGKATRDAHDRLLQDGGKGLRTAMHLWMSTAINWHVECQKAKKESNNRK